MYYWWNYIKKERETVRERKRVRERERESEREIKMRERTDRNNMIYSMSKKSWPNFLCSFFNILKSQTAQRTAIFAITLLS